MKATTEKSSTTSSKTATQTARPFFEKASGGSFFAPAIQTKMAVSQPGDKFEQEADKMANKVMRMPTPIAGKEEKLQRQPKDKPNKKEQDKIQKVALPEEKVQKKEDDKLQKAPTSEEKLQRKGGSVPSVSANVQSAIQNKKTGGQPLSSDVRGYMEPRFNADFSNVRVHHDAESASLNNQLSARAFTHQNHVFFSRDQYQPNSSEGKQLLAHELTHTIQQGHAIQHSPQVGSTTIQRQLGGTIKIYRKPETDTNLNPPTELRKATDEERKRLATYHPEVIRIVEAISRRKEAVFAYHAEGSKLSNRLPDYQVSLLNFYTNAYNNVSKRLDKAAKSLQNAELFEDIIIGLLINAFFTAGAAFIPATFIVCRTLISIFPSAGLSVAWSAAVSEQRSAARTALQLPPGEQPANKQVNLLEIHIQVLQLLNNNVPILENLDIFLNKAKNLESDIQSYKTGGTGKFPIGVTFDDIPKVAQLVELIMPNFDRLLSVGWESLSNLVSGVAEAAKTQAKTEAKMEKQLWIHWLTNLNSKAADLITDDIFQHLLEIGITGRCLTFSNGEFIICFNSKLGLIEAARGTTKLFKLVGKRGFVVKELKTSGVVDVEGQRYSATSSSEVPECESIVVIGAERNSLLVRPVVPLMKPKSAFDVNPQTLVRRQGVVWTNLNPWGTVLINGYQYEAVCKSMKVSAGTPVSVVEAHKNFLGDTILLQVEPAR